MFDEQSWDERYRSRAAVWSSSPNPQLMAEAAGLAPGTALDVGSGEGADACWLAARGWQVTAVDFAVTALQRAAAHAESLGADVAGLISWVHADLTTWVPAADHFDLVSAQFMQLPRGPPRCAVRPAGGRGGAGRNLARRRPPPRRHADHGAPPAGAGEVLHRRRRRGRPRPGPVGSPGGRRPATSRRRSGRPGDHHPRCRPAGPQAPVAVRRGQRRPGRGRRRWLRIRPRHPRVTAVVSPGAARPGRRRWWPPG